MISKLPERTTHPAREPPTLLPAEAAVHPCDALNQAESSELRAGALKCAAAYSVTVFQISQGGYGLPSCFERQ